MKRDLSPIAVAADWFFVRGRSWDGFEDAWRLLFVRTSSPEGFVPTGVCGTWRTVTLGGRSPCGTIRAPSRIWQASDDYARIQAGLSDFFIGDYDVRNGELRLQQDIDPR